MIFLRPPELDLEARAIISAARGGHEPSELSRARVRRSLELKLAAGLSLLVGSTTSALAGATKITLAVVALGTAVGAGAYVYPRYVAPKREAPARITRHVAAPVAAPELAPPARPVERVRRRHAPPARADNLAGLSVETTLLGAANAALSRQDALRALALLDEYDRRLGGSPTPGILAEERTATGILALCAAGRTDGARAEARHFRISWPRSPLAARVDGSCAGSAASSTSATRP